MSEELFARLARLRREERALPAPPPGLPEWLTTRFATRGARSEAAAGETGKAPEPPAALVEEESARGRFAARTRTYALEHAHGDWRLGEGLAVEREEFAWLTRDPALAGFALERCVFLDIETTGLSGGAGTIPFLIALGSFEENGAQLEFRLWQAFLREPGEEAAALASVAERVRAASGVVSFFGKSFDRHRLEDKMRLHRIAPPFDEKPHLDLYHPLVRLYRGAFPDGRLATFERELCGLAREDDLPGSLAPAAWFDFLAGRAHRLEGVFHHNELDVLSLVTLAGHLARSRAETRADGSALGGPARLRARALAALHGAHKQHALALEWLERALVRPGGDEGELWFCHAECLRKLGERERALEGFLRLARERNDAVGARAWAEVRRLARRLKHSELEAEACREGLEAAEHTLTGKQHARIRAALLGPPE